MSRKEVRDQLEKIPNDRIEDMFSEALRTIVNASDSELNLEEFDVDVKKDLGKPTSVEVTVFGVAGSTTQDEFCTKDKTGKIVKIAKGGNVVNVRLDNGQNAVFNLTDCRALNSNSYMIVYENI